MEIDSAIEQDSKKYGLVAGYSKRQCMAESAYNQAAKSPCGALGLFQLMPATARGLQVDPLNWRQNIDGGLKFMGQLKNQFRGDWEKAYAAYNWGPGNVSRALKQHGGAWKDHLPAETRGYLAKIL
jgi:soluble lytic murein transglycosylase-like protein